jgi:hypothetical protein
MVAMEYTVEQIMKWKPCYSIEKVEALIGSGKTSEEIAALDIPAKDRVWCLIRMLCDTRGIHAGSDFAGTCALRAHYFATSASYNAYVAATYAVNAAAYVNAADAESVAYAATYAVNAAAYVNAADAESVAYTATQAANAAAIASAYASANAAFSATACAAEQQWHLNYLVEAIEE